MARRPAARLKGWLLLFSVALLGVIAFCLMASVVRAGLSPPPREMFADDKESGRKSIESVQATKYRVEVFDSGSAVGLGKCISLDGRTQLCEADEHRYHEMLVHFAVAYLEAPPQNVILIAGGDCFALREILKYPSVKRVLVFEDEERLAGLSEKHLMTNARRMDQRVKWIHGDINRELNRVAETSGGVHVHQYDLAIIDCKFRPGVSLASKAVADNLLVMLQSNGIVAIGACSGSSFSPSPFPFKVPYSFHSDTHDATIQMSLHATFDMKQREKPDRTPAAVGDVSVSFYDHKNHVKYIPWFLRAKKS